MTYKNAETIQAAAAQEAVPYGYVFTDDPEKFAMPGGGFHLGPVPPKDAINVIPLYTAPVADAPVDLTNWAAHYSINTAAVEALQSLLAGTPAAPGIDLEQFRESVIQEAARAVDLWMKDEISNEAYVESKAKRDHLLALIDDSRKGGSDAEAMQLRYQLNSLRQLLSGFNIAVQNNPLQPPCTYLEEVRLSHEFQPGEGQKVAAALRNALNSNSEGATS